MIATSVAVGITGVLVSGGAMLALSGRQAALSAHHFWALGLGALFPAWLITFIALLQSPSGAPDAPLPPSGLLSSAAALLGVIATEFLVRPMGFQSRWNCWLLGASALFPGWIIALWGLR